MKKNKYEYIGDLSQLFRVENYRLEGGRKDGVRATSVTNEMGLQFTVVADRCMDIAYLSYKWINVSYINPCGIVAPEYYDPRGTQWLKSFTAGFMTTCGLNNVGNPCEEEEYMQLYHFNIGYPFLTPGCEMRIPSEKVMAANGHSANYVSEWNQVGEPNDLDEMCYFHELDKDGKNSVGIYNKEKKIGFTMTFNHDDLCKFIQWKNLSKGQYVMGLEPATNYIGGKVAERENGEVKKLIPGETKTHRIEIEFFG
ncbi:MAG: DUF4432 family protein [Lachnospiraceae bacterium]|nr:DUF4432 family protein [Lachnospiraceae bacterium]